MKSVLKVTCIAITSILLFSNAVFAKTGSFTIFKPSASSSGSIRITVTAEDGTLYNEVFNINGMSEQQVRDLIVTDMQSEGWIVSTTGNNGILITGHGTNPTKKIEEIYSADNALGTMIKCDGNVTIGEGMPGERDVSYSFSLPNADAFREY